MAKAKKTNPRKDLETYIIETLEKSLDKVKEGMSDKKFKRNIKKASKLIAEDFKLVVVKKVERKAKKKVKKTVEDSTAAAQ